MMTEEEKPTKNEIQVVEFIELFRKKANRHDDF